MKGHCTLKYFRARSDGLVLRILVRAKLDFTFSNPPFVSPRLVRNDPIDDEDDSEQDKFHTDMRMIPLSLIFCLGTETDNQLIRTCRSVLSLLYPLPLSRPPIVQSSNGTSIQLASRFS